MKVAITGASGFIGSNLKAFTGWDGYDIDDCDIRDPAQCESVLRNYDVVVHLAALAGVAPSIERPDMYIETNISGTANIARVCAKHNIRLLFASSSSVYELKSPYALTKAVGETLVNMLPDSCVMRFFTVYGENGRKDMAVYKFTKAISRGEPIEIYGDCARDYTYIGDLCHAIKWAVDTKLTGTHDFGHGQPVTTEDLALEISTALGKSSYINLQPHRECDAVQTCSNNAVMINSGAPRTSITSGITKFIRWYNESSNSSF